MKRSWMIVLLLLLLVVPAVYAQELLEPGQVVVGELTADVYELTYAFAGKEGDVVVIEADPVDALGDLNDTILILSDPSGAVLVDTTEAFSFGSSLIAAQLPASGTYTVKVTREDGAAGESVGEFELAVTLPQPITPDAPASSSTSSESRKQYFAVMSDTDFSLSYAKSGGDFFPDVLVSTIDEEDGNLNDVAQLSGTTFSVGMMGYFPANTLYIVTVRERLFDFNFDEVTADYTLSVSLAE
jgi:hypothetical protein